MLIPIGFFGGGNTSSYELISTTVLGADTATVSFSSIPQTYKHLQIRGTVRVTAITNTGGVMTIRLNGDSTASYSWHALFGNGGSSTSEGVINTTEVRAYMIPGSSAEANLFSPFVMDILDYSVAKNKTTRNFIGNAVLGAGQIRLESGSLYKTPAISTISLSNISTNNFVANSRFSLYGIKG